MGDAVEKPEARKQEEIQQKNGQTIVGRDDEKGIQQSMTVFFFWGCVAAAVASITVLALLISALVPPDEETELFSMPPDVRQHFAMGKLVKIDLGKDRVPLKVFVREEGKMKSSPTVLLCHGLGFSSFAFRSLISSFASRGGLRIIAFDFPGAGLSEKPIVRRGGLFLKLREIYKEIAEKGLLWRFEQMFETGSFPEPTPTIADSGVLYDSGDLSDSISQVVDLLASAPVHMVLHDASVEPGLAWATQNPSLVSSITLIDTYPGTPSFPVGLLGFPGLGFLILRSSVLLQALLQRCCVTRVTQAEAKSYAFLLRIRGGQEAVLKTWQMTNSTFDLISSIEKLGDLPVHLVWSNTSGQRWQELGDWLSSQLPAASYVSHSGGRWPQEDTASEVTEMLYSFIMSLPSTVLSLEGDAMHVNTLDVSMASDEHVGNTEHMLHHGHKGDNHRHNDDNMGNGYDEGLGYAEHMNYGGWVI